MSLQVANICFEKVCLLCCPPLHPPRDDLLLQGFNNIGVLHGGLLRFASKYEPAIVAAAGKPLAPVPLTGNVLFPLYFKFII